VRFLRKGKEEKRRGELMPKRGEGRGRGAAFIGYSTAKRKDYIG